MTAEKLSILMIEDNLDLCQGWEFLFDMLGHDFKYYQTAQELLEQTEKIKACDLIMTDYYLPDLNGVDLAKKVRDLTPEKPIIFLTGSKESFIKTSVESLDNSYLLYKPLNIEDIEKIIARLFPHSA